MPKGKKAIEQYDHKGKERVNNPPVGLVTPDTDKETGKKTYSYDPHLDPVPLRPLFFTGTVCSGQLAHFAPEAWPSFAGIRSTIELVTSIRIAD